MSSEWVFMYSEGLLMPLAQWAVKDLQETFAVSVSYIDSLYTTNTIYGRLKFEIPDSTLKKTVSISILCFPFYSKHTLQNKSICI